MKTLKNLMSLVVIALIAIVLSPIVGASPMFIAPVLLAVGVTVYVMRVKHNVSFFDGLAPEVWIPLVKEDFYPKNSFLNGANDMSALVNYDKINFAEAGADPAVLKNNSTYPIGTTIASDTPKEVVLDT